MADDGMLMNFDLGDGLLTRKPTFTGGRWKDRLTAKKVAKHHQNKRARGDEPQPTQSAPRPKSQRELFQNRNYNVSVEDYIGSRTAAQPLPRPVKEYIEPEVAPRPVKRQRRDPTQPVAGRDAASASIISGKLPPGSINIGGKSAAKKTTFDDEEDFAPASTSRKANENSYVQNQESSGPAPGRYLETGGKNGGKPTSVISSLFSFNPAAKTTAEKPEEEQEPTIPSNAPLSDEASTFTNMGVSKRLATHLSAKLEMKAPTAIQKAAVPQLLGDDSDAFIQAETGSGKTLAYLLPIVDRIISMSANEQVHRDSGLFAIILSPTRELCKQISTVLERLLRCAPWIVGTTVMGGESKNSEKARLRKGVNILIATPGRLADHLDNTEVLTVSTVRWLVLDEGDRLMELGFEEEIKSIVEKIGRRALSSLPGPSVGKGLPTRRVTILCSATMKMDVQKLGEISLKDAIHIKAEPSDEDTTAVKDGGDPVDAAFSAPAQLRQGYGIVPAKLRLVTLTAVLKRAFARRGSVMKAIIFISCADSVDFHFSLFSRPIVSKDDEKADSTLAIPTPTLAKSEATKETVAYGTTFTNPDGSNPILLHKLHGSLAQNIRTATLKSFTDSKDPAVLICTDVASRGLDLPNVDYVIEYDPAFSASDHLHRVGRTARAGASGRAMVFLLPGPEESYIPILAAGYHTGAKALTANTAEELLRKGFGGTGHEWEERATEWQLEIERWTLDSPKYLEMARRGYQSHIRAYSTHIAAERKMFDMKELHLGHLAKAFGLRDKPGSIRVPGLRPNKMTKADRSVAERKKLRAEKDAKSGKVAKTEDKAPEGERAIKERKRALDDVRVVDSNDAAKRMKAKMKEHMKSASEFNIG